MSAANEEVKVLTVASCSNIGAEHRSHVVVSGSYGGRYNAFNVASGQVRAVIMNDASIGNDKAGIVGLDFLDQIDLAAATADARTCHIGDGDHMLAPGIISYINRAAAALGCAPGQTVWNCAKRTRAATVPTIAPPPITEGARFVMRDVPGEPVLICADSIGMLSRAPHPRTARHWRFPRALPQRHSVAHQRPGCSARRPGRHEAEGLHRNSDRGGKAVAPAGPARTCWVRESPFGHADARGAALVCQLLNHNEGGLCCSLNKK